MHCECCGVELTKKNKFNEYVCKECYELEVALESDNLDEYYMFKEQDIDFKNKIYNDKNYDEDEEWD